MKKRFVTWRGLDGFRAECAEIELDADRLRATGTQIGSHGVRPASGSSERVEDVAVRYRLDYLLETGAGFVTTRLTLRASGEGWDRALDLRREPSGEWRHGSRSSGEADLAGPSVDRPAIAAALDCDLGLSPLTNLMPIRRARLTDGGDARDFLMAWVAVPELTVHASAQRYEPIDSRRVRYVGRHRSFEGELELDEDGLITRYPGLAERV